MCIFEVQGVVAWGVCRVSGCFVARFGGVGGDGYSQAIYGFELPTVHHMGALRWGPYNEDPTIRVPYLGSPIFGNSHIGPECPPNIPWHEGSLSQDGSTDNTGA